MKPERQYLELDWPAIFRFLGLLVTGIVVVITAFLYWVATHPGSAWKTFVQPRLFSKNTQIKTTSATFAVSKVSWREWKLEWTLVGLEINQPTPVLRVAGQAKLIGTLKIWKPNTELHLSELEFVADPSPLIYQPSDGPSQAQSPFQVVDGWRESLVRWNRFIRIDKLKVSVPELQIGAPAKDVVLPSWTITADKPAAADPLATQIQVGGKFPNLSLNVSGLLRMDQFGNGTSFLKTEVEATAKDWRGQTQLDLSLSEMQLGALIKASAQYGKISSGLDGQMTLTRSQVALEGKTDLENLPGPVPEIKGLAWNFNVPLVDDQWFGSQPGQVTASGPVSLIFVKKDVRERLETACKCKFPERLTAKIEGSLWPGHIFESSEIEQPVANIKVNLDPIQNAMMQLSLNGQFTVINNRFGRLQYWPVVETKAKFLNFPLLKAVLEAHQIIVPSPFDVLGGTIELNSKATISPNDKNLIVVPADIKVNLSSPSQKIAMNVNLQATIPQDPKIIDLYANFNIDDFVVELPPMDPIHGLPKIVKDSRLVTQPTPKESDGPKLRFIYDVRTTKPGAIRLLSKLAKPAVPVSVDVDRTKAGDTRGLIKTEPFELNYMHRTLYVDGLRLILDDRETADFAVDGRLRMEQSQYKVNIIVSGTIRSPLIKLTSEPELGRSDIISVILYDRTSDQLVAADRETVGVFDTAVADRAIGLLGLWVFASTPIRSFHYNPATKVYTATVQLAEGTTASLGTDWEEAAQVEVRKRVTKRWVLTASWKPGTEEKAQSGKLVLQWEKRF